MKPDILQVGRLGITLNRTLRIPDDGRTWPLPPGLGLLPFLRARDFPNRVPEDWLDDDSLFVPLYQREALWIGFQGDPWPPVAVRIETGGVNVLSGETDGNSLKNSPQNYLVCPHQPWLDGINSGEGTIRQFVATPLGSGYSIEAAIRAEEEIGGLRIVAFDPQPNHFPDKKPEPELSSMPEPVAAAGSEMGLGAGGVMTQKIYPDPYGIDVWQRQPSAEVNIRIVNSAHFHHITERSPPPSPIETRDYVAAGLPWFRLYDEHEGDIDPSPRLGEVPPVPEQESGP